MDRQPRPAGATPADGRDPLTPQQDPLPPGKARRASDGRVVDVLATIGATPRRFPGLAPATWLPGCDSPRPGSPAWTPP